MVDEVVVELVGVACIKRLHADVVTKNGVVKLDACGFWVFICARERDIVIGDVERERTGDGAEKVKEVILERLSTVCLFCATT